MKPGDSRLTVEWQQAGQPRPYADSVYEFTIFAEWIPYGKTELEPVQWNEGVMRDKAKAFRNFYTIDQNPDWSRPILRECSKVGPGDLR